MFWLKQNSISISYSFFKYYQNMYKYFLFFAMVWSALPKQLCRYEKTFHNLSLWSPVSYCQKFQWEPKKGNQERERERITLVDGSVSIAQIFVLI